MTAGEPFDRSQGYTVHSLARDVERLRSDISRMRDTTVTKELFDVAQGANRVDLHRLDHMLDELDKEMGLLEGRIRTDIANIVAKRDAEIKELRTVIDASSKETDRRFRAIVVGVLVVFVAPLTVGLILVGVNLLGRP